MNKTGRIVLWLIWIALLGWGLTGVVQRFGASEPGAYGSYVPWGLWVSAYIYFIGLSAGAFLLSSLTYVFGLRTFAPIGRIALLTAAVTLLMALVCIWFDLGHMERFYAVFTSPNFTSMMAWMVWLYTAYFILILAELWLEMRCDLARMAGERRSLAPVYRVLALGWRCPQDPVALTECHLKSMRWMRILGAIGIPLAIAFHGGVGALFATLASRPYWHHSLFPVLFLTGALASGGGLLLLIVSLNNEIPRDERRGITRLLGRIVLLIVLFDLLLEWSETSIPMWYGVGQDYDLYREVLFGRFWWVFWVIHFALGSLIPIILLLWKPASRWAAGCAGLLVAVTFLAVRLNLVIPGQVTPALEGLGEAYQHPRLVFEYVPTDFEWSIVGFVIAVGVAAFYLGKRLLPLHELKVQTT